MWINLTTLKKLVIQFSFYVPTYLLFCQYKKKNLNILITYKFIISD